MITPLPKEISQVRLTQKIHCLPLIEATLQTFLVKYRKSLAVFAIKNTACWREFTENIQEHLGKTSHLSILLHKLNLILGKNPMTFDRVLPRDIRNRITLAIPPSGYSNVTTLKKMRLLFLGDICLKAIPPLTDWIDYYQVPLHTITKNTKEIEDLLPELQYVNLTEFCPGNLLKKLHKVRHLTIQHLSYESVELLKPLDCLTSLTLQKCQMQDADMTHLVFLRLVSLNLICCSKITDHALKTLKQLHLISLAIRQCDQLTNEGIKHLAHLSSLTHLDISYWTNITDQGLLSLKGLPLLSLNITYCHQITNAGIEPFKLKHLEYKHCHKIT